MKAFALALTTVVLFAGAANAQETPSATELRMGLTGRWTGALSYRDYQSDRLVDLPVTTTISTPGDGVTLISQSAFDDGPGHVVWITTVSLDDPATGTSRSASFRRGGTPSLSEERLAVADYSAPMRWTLTYSETAEDDDEPAEIRITETRDGDALLSVKEVRPVGGGEADWRFRNQTRLTRTGD